jgi:hypothetical protein
MTSITTRNIKKLVLEELENTRFPKNKTRANVSGAKPTESFAMGAVNYRGQKKLGGKLKGPSRWNEKFPILFKLIKKLIKINTPNFNYTTIQVNKNVLSHPHVDKNNVGPSYIIALGDFEDGELIIEGKEFNIRNKWKYFDGTKGHWVNSFKGTRYSLVFFTHTFKPPNPSTRYLKVTKHGLYDRDKKTKQNKLIKKYLTK